MRPTWLNWIELNNRAQLTWIGEYLADKGYLEFAPREGHPPDGVTLIQAMENRAREDKAAFRYWADKMRAAWRQKQYRTRNGQQVAFQLSDRVRKDLDRLAKERGRTKVETLRQVISDAADQHDHDRQAVKKLGEESKQDKALYRRISDGMLKALAEELHQRCRLEALIGACEDESLKEEDRETYHALVAKRVAELEAELQDMNLARPGGASLMSRMRALAESSGPGRLTDDTL